MQPQVVVVNKSGGCLKAFVIVMGVLSIIGIAVAVLAAFVFTKAAEHIAHEVGVAAQGDYSVDVASCTADSLSYARATGTLVNRSSKRQGFAVTVRFTTADNVLISENTTFIDTLDIGQTGRWTVNSFSKVTSEPRCAVGSVSYTIFDNES